jgi:UDP:flavonoid glycosyltransferase YjiC (YdhE family)
VVAAGGSGVGVHLMRRAIEAYTAARSEVAELRMVVVAGPRVRVADLPAAPGVERVGYVHELYRHLAACDVAITHGGLSTTMELTAARTPFLYFPLENHFEQNFHVAHRLERLRSGRRMSYSDSPEEIAEALVEALRQRIDVAELDLGGAERSAALISALLSS